jgi:hypothetical protein
MSGKPLAVKMHVKAGKSMAFVNVPESLGDLAVGLPEGVKVVQDDAPADIILIFIADRVDAERRLPEVKTRLAPGGALWVAFRKANKTDVNRDSLFVIADTFGLQACANVSIDDNWSALRFKVIR